MLLIFMRHQYKIIVILQKLSYINDDGTSQFLKCHNGCNIGVLGYVAYKFNFIRFIGVAISKFYLYFLPSFPQQDSITYKLAESA